MKNFLVLTIALCLQTVFSQKMQLGKVTIEELREKVHPIDTAASAAYIFKKGKTSFFLNSEGNWFVTTDVEIKIKIYNKKGLEKANQEVAYFVGGNSTEKVFFSDATTYNLVNGKIEKTKLKSEGEFTEVVNDDWKQKKIVLPAVKEGSIIEFSYKLVSPYITRINDWYFQDDIPMNYVEYATYIPQYFQYRSVITGYEDIETKVTNVTGIKFNETKSLYSRENIPAIREESFVNNIKNYTSILKYELASINYPNQSIENLSLDWDGVAKKIYDNENFGGELKLDSYYKEELNSIIEKNASRDEKIKSILAFVKEKMKWNEENGILCDKGVKKAYKERTGNVAEINLMLVSMLRYAGISANPVLISTKSNGIPMFPNRTAFNYVIAAVEIKEDLILLDATNSNSHFNILPIKTLNWTGRLIRDDGSSADVDLMPKIISNDKVNVLASIDASGTIEGKLREQYFDYAAFQFREKNENNNQDLYIENLEKKHQGIEITDYSVSNIDDLENQVIENYSFKNSNVVEVIGDKMYFSPMLFFEKKENPFKQENRKFPIDYSVPFSDSYLIVVNIPSGYEVESVPEVVNLAMEDNYGYYLFNIKTNNNTIQLSTTFNINSSIIPSKQYATLKMFYKMMIDKQNEKIVLKKVK